MARRICTIVTDGNLRAKRLQELRVYLSRQNYPKNLISSGINKAKEIPISTLRNVRRRENNDLDNIPFVVTHNPRNHNILYAAKTILPNLGTIRKYEQSCEDVANHKQQKAATKSEEATDTCKILNHKKHRCQKMWRPPMRNL